MIRRWEVDICPLFSSLSLQALKSKLYDELEEMVARYLRPVNLQLEDIYKRLSSLEKRINQ